MSLQLKKKKRSTCDWVAASERRRG